MVVLVLSFVCSRANTQPLPTYLGGGVSIGFNVHTMSIPVYEDSKLCGVFENGNSILPNGFLLFERPLGRTTHSLWLAPRLHLGSLGASVTTPAIDAARGRNPADSSLVDITRVHTLDASILSLGADLFVRYPITTSLFLFGGPSVSYLLRRDALQTDNITSPAQAVYIGSNSSSRTLSSGVIPSSSSLFGSLTLGGSLDLPISPKLMLSPELSYTLPLTSIRSDFDWKITTIALGVSIKFNLATEKKLEVVEQKPEAPHPVSEINARVKILGVLDSMGGEREVAMPQLRVEEFVRREAYPILSYIFFDSASATIPLRYHGVSADSAASLPDSRYIGQSPLAIYHETLNILGKRLQARPGITITLTGSNSNSGSETNALELSRQRAESVKQYLVQTWKISSSRISVQAVNLPRSASTAETSFGGAENRRVEVTSNDPSLLDPLIVEEVDRIMNPPKLRLRTTVDSRLPLKTNVLELVQGSRSLVRFNSGKPVQDWTPAANELPRTDTALVATLTLVDSMGSKLVLHDTARVEQLTVQRKRQERVEDKIVEHYNLVTFDFDKADLDARSLRVIDQIAPNLTAQDRIRLVGYTDLTGDREHNQKLSQARAQNVEAALRKAAGTKASTIHFESRGDGQNDLVDNRLPEGRFLSRTVFVLVERPIGEQR